MRRMAAIFTACAGLAALAATPAVAHPGLEPVVGTVGTRAAFRLVVDSHFPAATLTSVEVTPPPGFRVERFSDVPGWAREDRGPTVRYTGELPLGRALAIDLVGTPTEDGIEVFTLTTGSSDGQVARWDKRCTDPSPGYKGAHLFVDVDPGTACDPPAAPSKARQLGLGLVAAGLVLGAAYPILRRRRSHEEPPPERQRPEEP